AERLNPAVLPMLSGPVGPLMLRGRPDRPVTPGMPVTETPQEQMRRAPLPDSLRRALRLGSSVGIVAPLLLGAFSGGDAEGAGVFAVVIGVLGAVLLGFRWRKLPGHVRAGIRIGARQDRIIGLALGCVAAGPVLVGVFGLLANPALLAGSIATGMVALG